MANAAFYFGLVRHLAESDRPLWSQMSFQAAEENFHVAAEDGIDAHDLLARARRGAGDRAGAAPAAADGPRRAGRRGASRADESDRLLGIIEQRCLLGRNGAELVRRPDAPARGRRTGYDALRATLLEYRERMHSNEPVHTWD